MSHERERIIEHTALKANTTVEEVELAMNFFHPSSLLLWNTPPQLAAAGIGVLANSGIKAHYGGAALRRIVAELSRPSGELAAAMDGLTVKDDGLVDVLRHLDGRMGVTDVMQVFGERNGQAFVYLCAEADSLQEFAEVLTREAAA